ncbi:MAG TPA: sigma-70 family RNA polymerase sigma factor [Solirubrobacterales bacterium]|jgi:RNA polymerase sigma-70 factor (ECF subfamily)|nr:sigma-70 family RNA polymerase sigma factor [Solirubrobacterales bacterium]
MATALMTTPTQRPADSPARDWVERLRADGPEGAAAVAELHALLLKAARFEIGRRGAELKTRGGDADDLAHQAADDALVAILGKLDDFRGESRFTTWAYKFALLEAAVKVRRRAWQGREVPLEDEAWRTLAAAGSGAGRRAEDAELFAALREEIERSLGPRQREVLVAVALNDVPIDVLAERLGSTRGALYKNLHDARRKLRGALAARGFDLGGGEEER